MSSSSYSLDANLAVLRFYQLSPDLTKSATVAKILLKALMALPGADFKVCMHLVPDSLQVVGIPACCARQTGGMWRQRREQEGVGVWWCVCVCGVVCVCVCGAGGGACRQRVHG